MNAQIPLSVVFGEQKKMASKPENNSETPSHSFLDSTFSYTSKHTRSVVIQQRLADIR